MHRTFFADERLGFSKIGPPINEKQILTYLQGDFSGKSALVQFYLEHNGGWFKEAPYFPATYKNKPNKNINIKIDLDQIYYIPTGLEMEKCGVSSMDFTRDRDYKEMHDFNMKHIPIAGFDGAIEVWLERSSGQMIFINWESDDPFAEASRIASSFYDFVSGIKYRPMSAA